MLIKFIRPTLTAEAALRYCIADHDDGGDLRRVYLVRGSPASFLATTRRLAFRETYKSYVLGWQAGDVPTVAQIDAILNDFERLALAGLSPARFSLCAFLHVPQQSSREAAAKGVDLHILVATCDVATGKHFNPSVRWTSNFRPLQDKYNYTNGWSRADDPRSARAIGYVRSATFVNWRRRRGRPEAAETDKQSILGVVQSAIDLNQLRSEGDLFNVLRPYCRTAEYVDDGVAAVSMAGRHIRLRGQVFRRGFDFMRLPKPRPPRRRTLIDQQEDQDPVKARQAADELEQVIARWAMFNRRRYALHAPDARPTRPDPIGLSWVDEKFSPSVQEPIGLKGPERPVDSLSSSVDDVQHGPDTSLNSSTQPNDHHENQTRPDAARFAQRFHGALARILGTLARQVQRWRDLVAIADQAADSLGKSVDDERRRTANARSTVGTAIDNLDEALQRVGRQIEHLGDRMGEVRRARAALSAVDRGAGQKARERVSDKDPLPPMA